MVERKKLEFLSFRIILEIRDKAPDEWDENACGGCYDAPDDDICFKLWFALETSIPTFRTISHEVWHLFMTIMNYADKHEHTFEELNNEIYAYSFHTLFGMVMDSLLESKAYQKAISD